MLNDSDCGTPYLTVQCGKRYSIPTHNHEYFTRPLFHLFVMVKKSLKIHEHTFKFVKQVPVLHFGKK